MSINHKQTCGLLPAGIGSTVLNTRGLRWNFGAPALVTCLSIADHRSNFDGMISTSNHHVPEEPVVYVKTTGGRSSCDPKPLPEYHRPRMLPIHLCSISVRSQGAWGKLYTDASGPAIKFFKRDKPVPYPPPSSMLHPYSSDEPGVEQLVRVFTQVLDSNSSLRRCVYLRSHAGPTKLVLQKSVRFGPAQGPELWDGAMTRY